MMSPCNVYIRVEETSSQAVARHLRLPSVSVPATLKHDELRIVTQVRLFELLGTGFRLGTPKFIGRRLFRDGRRSTVPGA